ncbi:MAG TPA: hypothetical protein VN670_00630, partial [Acidobacteriaceae bacterium]|nr:hypothetical protein [Acidobacteriaceae bacterium]
HTVAEVFYDGAYHYFDSDMMGYNPIGNGPLKQRDVASVYQLEHNRNIILKNVTSPTTSNPKTVDYPWYPADVRADAMSGMADLFSTTDDNYLYAYNRVPHGHTMDFVLRPGEKMIRYFQPTPASLSYIPYAFDGKQWEVSPDIATWHMKTANGPRSEKDHRTWATGTIEYRPAGTGDASISKQARKTTYTFAMPSPYVIIDANFSLQATLTTAGDKLIAETSTDGGRTWAQSASLSGPFNGTWKAEPARLSGETGRFSAVSGSYGYLVRFTLEGSAKEPPAVQNFVLSTLFQLNPRTLPTLTPGVNVMQYKSGSFVRRELPVRAEKLKEYASRIENASYEDQNGQGYLINKNSEPAEVIFTLTGNNGHDLSGFDVGGRFLDLRNGIAPNKFTAEIRKVTPWPANAKDPGTASISWSTSNNGPWKTLWTYDPKLTWLDGQPIPQVLRWPEIDRSVRDLPAGTRRVYVRYSIDGLAIDHFRLATERPADSAASQHLQITQIWKENGVEQKFQKDILRAGDPQQYEISIPQRAQVDNVALVLECPASKM